MSTRLLSTAKESEQKMCINSTTINLPTNATHNIPLRESLFELYLWFGQERGHGKKLKKNDIIEDLNLLGSHICSRKEEIY